MNVYLTNYCNLNCPYCFADDYMADSCKREMAREDLMTVLDFLARSGFMTLRLEGGEPTLHPEFIELFELALSRGFNCRLFTNGLFSEAVRDHLASRSEHVNCTWNINAPSFYTDKQWARLRGNLAAVIPQPNRHSLGVNIYRADQDLEPRLTIREDEAPAGAVRGDPIEPDPSRPFDSALHPQRSRRGLELLSVRIQCMTSGRG